MNLTDASFQRGILMLERLFAALTPKETVLFPNYPNPFNPEKDLKFMRILSKIRALQQCSFANFLAVAILALSLPLLISCGGLSEDQEELLQADPCVQDLLNGIPRTFRTEGGFFTRSRTEAYAGDLFFLIAYGKRIPSGVYVSPGFPDSVHAVLEDPEWKELTRIFDHRGLEAAYRACYAGELVSSIFGSIDRVTAAEIAEAMLAVRLPWE